MLKRKLVFVLMLLVLATVTSPDATVMAKEKKHHKHKHKKGESADQDKTTQDGEPPLSRKEEKKLKKEKRKKEKQERKKQKREQRKNKRHSRDVTVETESGNAPGTEAPVRRFEDEYPLTKIKDRYRVDILAALYLDDLVKGESVTFKNKIPEKAEQGLAFYEGITIAADSLKKAGFKIDIYVHDIASAKESPEMLVLNNTLDSTDLIIGAVPSRDIPLMAAFARKKKINFISALSPDDAGVKNNAYFTVMQPSLKSHCEWISGNMATRYKGVNISMLYRTSVAGDNSAYKCMSEDNMYHVRYRELLCNTLPDKDKLAKMFDTAKPNIVIIPIQDISYADSLLSRLAHYFPSTHFEIYGMPSWSGMNDLRKVNALPNLSVYVTVPFYVNMTSTEAKYVDRVCRRDYGAKPTESVFRGYETMFWYASLLKRYGTIFNVKYEDNTMAPFTSYEMKPLLDNNSNVMFYENKHVFLSKYEGGVNKTQ